MRIALSSLLCLMLSVPVYAQQSQERHDTEVKANIFFWSGITLAATGATTMITVPKFGVPLAAGGGALIYYGVHLRNRAKQMPFTAFGVVPLKRGVAFGLLRSW